MARYAVFLSDDVRFATIDNYVSGVLSLNRYCGYDVAHIRQDFSFIATMTGLRRILGDPEAIRVTLSVENILSMFFGVDIMDSNEKVMWTCLVTSFRSLLRKSNLVPDKGSDREGHFLRRKSVRFYNWGVMLHISSSKTIQYGQRTHLVPVTYSPGSPLCAATLLWQHFRDSPADGDSPAFLLRRGSRTTPLTYGILLKFLKRLLRIAGIDTNRAGVHSLRRAGAAFLHQCGIPLEDIRQTGDWSSLAALLYLAKPMNARIALDTVVSNASGCRSRIGVRHRHRT